MPCLYRKLEADPVHANVYKHMLCEWCSLDHISSYFRLKLGEGGEAENVRDGTKNLFYVPGRAQKETETKTLGHAAACGMGLCVHDVGHVNGDD